MAETEKKSFKRMAAGEPKVGQATFGAMILQLAFGSLLVGLVRRTGVDYDLVMLVGGGTIGVLAAGFFILIYLKQRGSASSQTEGEATDD
jgi:hypothetical protein